MMSRSVLALGGLLVLALVLSYVSWTRTEKTAAADRIRLVAASAESVDVFRWKTDEGRVEIDALEDVHGRWLRVTVESGADDGKRSPREESSEIARPDGGDEKGPSEEAPPSADDEPEGDDPAPETTNETGAEPRRGSRVVFTGGAQARRVMEAVAPLLATRRIEGVQDDRLEAMDLIDSVRSIEVTARGRTHVFELGGRTYGGGYQYLRRPGERDVYLIEASPLRPLEHGARRLMKRELLDVRRNDIEKLTVESFDGRGLVMLHQGRDTEPRRSYFADESDPERGVQQYENWVGKVLALRVMSYVGEEDAPTDLDTTARLFFETEEAREPVSIEIFKHVDDDGEARWYAYSDHTRSLVSLPAAATSELMADLDAMLVD